MSPSSYIYPKAAEATKTKKKLQCKAWFDRLLHWLAQAMMEQYWYLNLMNDQNMTMPPSPRRGGLMYVIIARDGGNDFQLTHSQDWNKGFSHAISKFFFSFLLFDMPPPSELKYAPLLLLYCLVEARTWWIFWTSLLWEWNEAFFLEPRTTTNERKRKTREKI
jgi:hypothetical protein